MNSYVRVCTIVHEYWRSLWYFYILIIFIASPSTYSGPKHSFLQFCRRIRIRCQAFWWIRIRAQVWWPKIKFLNLKMSYISSKTSMKDFQAIREDSQPSNENIIRIFYTTEPRSNPESDPDPKHRFLQYFRNENFINFMIRSKPKTSIMFCIFVDVKDSYKMCFFLVAGAQNTNIAFQIL